METPLASVPQGRRVMPLGARLRLAKSEYVFLLQLIIIFFVFPALMLLDQEIAYLSSLCVAQVLFGFASYPAIGRVRLSTRVLLVLTMPLAPAAAAIWYRSTWLANCAIIPFFLHMVARLVLLGMCSSREGLDAADSIRALFVIALAFQGQLWLSLPFELTGVMEVGDGSMLTYASIVVAMTAVVGVSVFWKSADWSKRALMLSLLAAEFVLVTRPEDIWPDWAISVTLMLIGATGLVKAILKFRSREHQAARLIYENVGLSSSPQRQALIDRIESFTCEPECQEDCPICLMPFEQGGRLRKLPCGHTFCDSCIRTWLLGADLPSCPSCRATVTPAENSRARPQRPASEGRPAQQLASGS
eukprot:TRINITY_DN100673_c0_g1_i1.p1 TRINITY_DN100673_c0_g1~~TRINITY_DN100673_c0_g1_i1.p1  ORF type:complete len:360 (-),score=27.72 TRINITY_DN100673_c0_g1_i1:264-1343(-)